MSKLYDQKIDVGKLLFPKGEFGRGRIVRFLAPSTEESPIDAFRRKFHIRRQARRLTANAWPAKRRFIRIPYTFHD